MSRLLWWANVALALGTLLALMSPYVAPGRLWPVAFAGLAFPTFVLLHVGALGWWLFRGHHRAWLSAACLAASMPGVLALVGFGESPIPDEGQALTLVNYNLLGGARIADEDRDAFRQNLDAFASCVLEGADVVAFQETPAYAHVRNGLTARLEETGLSHHFYPRDVHVSLHARFPLLEPTVVADYNQSNAILTALIVPFETDTLRIFAVHLQSNSVRLDAERVAKDAARDSRRAYWKIRSVASNYRQAARKRAAQSTELAVAIRASTYPVVVLGDLNDTPQSFAVNELLRAGLSDSFRESGQGWGITYPGTIPGLRIDYLMASEDLHWYKSEVLGCEFSDHKAVRGVVEFPRR